MDKRSTDKSDQAVDLEKSSKRKLVKGIAAAPVIMALGHRPAFGQICTLSGFGSIQAGTHISHHPNYETTPCNTYSHGGWKTVLAGDPDWNVIAPITPFTPFSQALAGGRPPKLKKSLTYWSEGIKDSTYQELANYFLGGATYTPDNSDPILLEVLTNGKVLSREICNAFLNASFAAASGIPYFTPLQIIQLWNTGQAVTSSGELIPQTPLTDAELEALLKETYH
ncbi:hypothetical protein DV711_04140 [Motiliproteus coralliicola]|uniref:Uncharacterized protein n=1 Tax=Motiliproteus coralliicola TaxID=2283196 RepID=A0A369WT72_9GAMM|nr:hypothetical protein [Motiliproteus coralliicola]RDE24781.1 hypothetical protein DV711_04140 [Motiliproteus coralliicola]